MSILFNYKFITLNALPSEFQILAIMHYAL